MAGIRRAWTNSACLILATGKFRYLNNPLSRAEAETLPLPIFTHGDLHSEAQVLFVKRSSHSGFMANIHVFPGGILDESDSSAAWLDVFAATKDCFSSLCMKTPLPMYNDMPPSAGLPGEVALRICAIREMFEESGVLIARNRDQSREMMSYVPGSISPAVMSLSEECASQWRNRVHANAQNFIAMCRELQCVPDIWSLVEWGNWLTPRHNRRRYDTVFYLCCSEEKPVALADLGETTSAEWYGVQEVMAKFRKGDLRLSPPQFCEISAFASLKAVPFIHSFGLKRFLHGNIGRLVSQRIITNDGHMISVNELDDLFSKEGLEERLSDTSKPPPGTIHHPQSSRLRDKGVFLVVSDSTVYEYTCPTHSAAELQATCQQLCRMEMGGKSSSITFDAPDALKEIDIHLKLHKENVRNLTSKL